MTSSNVQSTLPTKYCQTFCNEFDFRTSGRKDKKNKLKTFYGQNLSKNGMELLIPVNTFNYTKHGNEKIQRKLDSLGKEYSKENIPSIGLRNRPILNLNRGEFDFNPKNIIDPSPTNRILVTPYRKRNKSVQKNSLFNKYQTGKFKANDNNADNYLQHFYKKNQNKKLFF